ncbi:MAG: hypothetical protein IJX12_02790, partial [Lachnospiraceae bacterium]|nr:hypothetical protein [Lachnospiraceae bacterium]
MVSTKINYKIAGMLIVLCMLVVGMFEICSKAVVRGTYVDLYGSLTRNAEENIDYAQVIAYNKSSIRRYITASVKDGNWNTIRSTSANVGYNASAVLNGV